MKQDGPKVLVGDNLSSHISPKVLKLCAANNIRFVCLPPNSTHITQPLDVAFFRPMKIAWRKILSQYKESVQGRKKTSLEKSDCPALLKQLMEAIKENSSDNLKSGFRRSSLYPVDENELLKQFNNRETYDTEALEDNFKKYLEERTQTVANSGKRVNKRKKLNVSPGKSICPEDLNIVVMMDMKLMTTKYFSHLKMISPPKKS